MIQTANGQQIIVQNVGGPSQGVQLGTGEGIQQLQVEDNSRNSYFYFV